MTYTAPRQLGLPFVSAPLFTADFLEGPSTAEALAWLGRVEEWPLGRLAVWGEAGTGKSHVLHLWAARQGAEIVQGPTLGLEPPTRAVAIDDADGAPETPLFHLLNAAAEAGWPVLLTGRAPAARWPTRLPDLASRLRATTSVELRQPDDEMLRSLLARLLATRQIAVPEAVQTWLLTRLPRTAGAIREAAARLDRASLAARSPVTRQIASAALAVDDDDFADHVPTLSHDGPSLL